MTVKTILSHINDFYTTNQHISISRRPDIIHVADKYVIFRIKEGHAVQNRDGTAAETVIGSYYPIITNPDIQAIIWTIDELQNNATVATHINFNYSEIIDRINRISRI